jgi:hypothetical protein
MNNVPDPVAGADVMLSRPASGIIEDTGPVNSPGSDLIVTEARLASPQKPLLIFVGGQLTTIASAYLTDPSIADRMVILATSIFNYNDTDAWANYILSKRCKLINFGDDPWWPQPPQTPMMPLARFDELPDSEIKDELLRLATLFSERSTRPDNPIRDDGLADGAGLMLVFNPLTWKAVEKLQVSEPFEPVPVTSDPYDILDASEVDFDLMREEFFNTFK